jgi:hypothetical protein
MRCCPSSELFLKLYIFVKRSLCIEIFGGSTVDWSRSTTGKSISVGAAAANAADATVDGKLDKQNIL